MDRKELQKKYGEEKVLIMPFNKLDFIPDGFTFRRLDMDTLKFFDNGEFEYRYICEGDNSLQQIIPYTIIINKCRNKILCAERVGGEPRLLGKLSIGFGGHINQVDGGSKYVFHGACRELTEELNIVNIENMSPIEMLGFIRDKYSPSELHDHTGIVLICYTDDENIAGVNEKENLKAEWIDLDSLEKNYDRLENWSKFLCDFFASRNMFI